MLAGGICHLGPPAPSPSSARRRSAYEQVRQELAVAPQEIEDHERDGHLERKMLQRHRVANMHATLQQLETRSAVLVERDDLAVEQCFGAAELVAEAGEFRVAGRDVATLPVRDPHATVG